MPSVANATNMPKQVPSPKAKVIFAIWLNTGKGKGLWVDFTEEP